jgi:Flp pilus assembly protein TadD
MNAPFARRNDPCPCGSGLKYKACHGSLGAAPPAQGAPPIASDEALANGLDAMRNGQTDLALAWFDRILASDPAQAFALHFKGYAFCQKGDFATGLPLLEKAAGLGPDNPDFHGNLGIVRYALGNLEDAKRSLERAIQLAPQLAEAHSNLSMTLRELGDFERALAEARTALALNGNLAAARLNFAMALLSLGRYAEAWPAFNWRPNAFLNLRDAAVPSRSPHAAALPDLARVPQLTLHGEQGVGDVLFFLRFAPELARRGAKLRFWGDSRILPMLGRTGLFEQLAASQDPAGGAPQERLIWVGDLPGFLGAGEEFPAPLALAPEPGRKRAMEERLAGLGPAPYIALTWRAGLERRGKAVLAKAIEPRALGAALHGVGGTLVSVQRHPRPGELEALSQAAGTVVHDLSAANEDLEEILALIDCVDEYVGVSNTNMHLRAGVGRTARVLVPHPPEWRWLGAQESRWFPGFNVYRATGGAGWGPALAALERDLREAAAVVAR